MRKSIEGVKIIISHVWNSLLAFSVRLVTIFVLVGYTMVFHSVQIILSVFQYIFGDVVTVKRPWKAFFREFVRLQLVLLPESKLSFHVLDVNCSILADNSVLLQ